MHCFLNFYPKHHADGLKHFSDKNSLKNAVFDISEASTQQLTLVEAVKLRRALMHRLMSNKNGENRGFQRNLQFKSDVSAEFLADRSEHVIRVCAHFDRFISEVYRIILVLAKKIIRKAEF